MSVRQEVEARLATAEPERAAARLPRSLRTERASVRVLMLQRLAMQGAARRASSAMARSQAKVVRPFRLDVRQRVVVKALVCRHRGAAPGGALASPHRVSSPQRRRPGRGAGGVLQPRGEGRPVGSSGHTGVGERPPPLPLHRQSRTRRPYPGPEGLHPPGDAAGCRRPWRAEAPMAGDRSLRHRSAAQPRPGPRPAGRWPRPGHPAGLHGLRVPRPYAGGGAGAPRRPVAHRGRATHLARDPGRPADAVRPDAAGGAGAREWHRGRRNRNEPEARRRFCGLGWAICRR